MQTIRTPKKQRKFLETLCETANVRLACQSASLSRSAVYHWRKSDSLFAEAWAEAMEIAADVLEAEARRRAYEGVEEPVGFYKGEPSATVRRYSDTLLIFLLKAARPEKYRDNLTAEIGGALGLHVERVPMHLH